MGRRGAIFRRKADYKLLTKHCRKCDVVIFYIAILQNITNGVMAENRMK